ncbi:MAG: ankyrin repeat domain-containing protein, partial [Pseudomonadota bacterium]
VSVLLKAGAPADPSTDQGVTPLMMAVDRRRAGVVRLLLAAGASPTAASKSGDTPLSIAVGIGDQELLDVLKNAHRK